MISNELYRTCDIALLCEETVNGLIAATEYQKVAGAARQPNTKDAPNGTSDSAPPQDFVQVILDFESIDWNFKVQPGNMFVAQLTFPY